MKTAIFGDVRTALPRDSRGETFIGVFGDFDLDASAVVEPVVALTFIALFGDVKVRVPPGSRVTVMGLRVLGDQRIEVSGGDGPEVRLRTYGLASDLKVTDSSSS